MVQGLMDLLSLCWKPFSGSNNNSSSVNNHNSLDGDFGKDGLLWFKDTGKCASGDFSMAVIQANMVLEDQSQIESGPFGTFVGVYDGHGGPEAARYVCDHLFKHFQGLCFLDCFVFVGCFYFLSFTAVPLLHRRFQNDIVSPPSNPTDMDDTDVEINNADKMEVDVANDRKSLLTSKETQVEGEHMHLEGQNSCKVEKEQKSIDIVTNQVLEETGMQNSGVHSDILGEKMVSKYTTQNISGENLIEKEKNLGKGRQECTLLPSVEADQSGMAGTRVDDAVKNAIPETENKRRVHTFNNKPGSAHSRPAFDQVEPVTPIANETFKVKSVDTNDIKTIEEAETGTPEEQAAFMKELETFFRENGMVFRPPKFYGKLLNCLKLYRSVIRHGGYDRVTAAKSVWRQIGESFNPPKTCTTAAYAFRIFYEKALLEYERHKMKTGELQLALPSVPGTVSAATNVTTGSGRARRDAAARAMQGWHEQRHYGYGEIAEPIIKDKNFNNMAKREKIVKNIGSVKNKRLKEVEHPVKAARMETSKQLVSSVVDVGPPADWVKISVREHKDCFEVYALVPGLLREEVRVQSDPEGRLVITGQPEQRDNPWGITAFQKVISLPARIDPLQTSAVVGLHGRLFVRIPFDRSM